MRNTATDRTRQALSRRWETAGFEAGSTVSRRAVFYGGETGILPEGGASGEAAWAGNGPVPVLRSHLNGKGRGNPMASFRIDRTNEDILRELTAILRTVKDPRVTAAMLSIVRVEVTSDLSYAKVYVSAMEGMDAAKNAAKGLASAQGYIRHALGGALHLRHVPELRFIPDDSIAYSAGIAKTLGDLERAEKERGRQAEEAGTDE